MYIALFPRRLHLAGVDFNPLLLHCTPPASLFPVAPGTRMLGGLVSWEHATSWSVPTLEQLTAGAGGGAGAAACVYDVHIGHDSPGMLRVLFFSRLCALYEASECLVALCYGGTFTPRVIILLLNCLLIFCELTAVTLLTL
jgi:hypothetical protein